MSNADRPAPPMEDRGVAAVSPSERAKACAAEVLKNCAMKFSQPEFFRPDKPQAEIDWAISMAGHIIETFFPTAPAVPPSSPDLLEQIGRIMHESWSKTKRAQGFHGPGLVCADCEQSDIAGVLGGFRCAKFHADLIPWEQLPEKQKDINRHAFDAVLESGILAVPPEPTPPPSDLYAAYIKGWEDGCSSAEQYMDEDTFLAAFTPEPTPVGARVNIEMLNALKLVFAEMQEQYVPDECSTGADNCEWCTTYRAVECAIAHAADASPIANPGKMMPANPEVLEGICENCHQAYGIWFAPNEIWNRVVPGRVGMLCPNCFINRATRAGIVTGWELRPAFYAPPTNCICAEPTRSWNPAVPCLKCGGRLDQEANQSPASAASEGQTAESEIGTEPQSSTPKRLQDSSETLSAAAPRVAAPSPSPDLLEADLKDAVMLLRMVVTRKGDLLCLRDKIADWLTRRDYAGDLLRAAVPPEPTPRTDWPDYIDVGGPDTDRGMSTEELGSRAPEPTPVGMKERQREFAENQPTSYLWKQCDCAEPRFQPFGAYIRCTLCLGLKVMNAGDGQAMQADSRAPAEVLEALKRDVRQLRITEPFKNISALHHKSSYNSAIDAVERLFKGAVKEPTK